MRYQYKNYWCCNNGEELVKLGALKLSKIVITDIRRPKIDGLEATRIIKNSFPHTRVLAMTIFDQPKAIRQMLDAGATSYILKTLELKMLSKAIVTVADEETFFDPSVSFNFMTNYREENVTIAKTDNEILSTREKEILQSIANGKSSKEISKNLFVAITT